MNKQLFLKVLITMQVTLVLVYTLIVFSKEGIDLFNILFTNIGGMNWSGQFNLDFISYLTLSGIWIMWRNEFTKSSILLGISAMILGIILFGSYVLYLLFRENGDLKKVLIGRRLNNNNSKS